MDLRGGIIQYPDYPSGEVEMQSIGNENCPVTLKRGCRAAGWPRHFVAAQDPARGFAGGTVWSLAAAARGSTRCSAAVAAGPGKGIGFARRSRESFAVEPARSVAVAARGSGRSFGGARHFPGGAIAAAARRAPGKFASAGGARRATGGVFSAPGWPAKAMRR